MSLSRVPPGLLFFAQTVPKLGLPLLLIFIAQRTLSDDLPSFIWIIAYVLAVPATLAFKRISRRLRENREIKRFGARRVPQVPTYWPGAVDVVLDNVKSFNEGYIGDLWEEYTQKLGPIMNLRLFWEDMIVTTEPDDIKAILATEFDKFEKGPKSKWTMQSVLGTGVFNADGDMWKFHRAITRPFFVRDRVTDFELFDRHAEVAIALLKERFSQGEAIDFQDIMSRFTLDSASEFLFGSCVDSLSAPLPYAYNSSRQQTLSQPHPSDAFATAFNQAQYQIALRSRLVDSWPLAEFWKDKSMDSMKIINEYIDPILSDALAKKRPTEKNKSPASSNDTSPTGVEDGQTLLDHLVSQTDDHIILRDEILNIMIAGRDTTMATLTFVIYCLEERPEVLRKLREEILTIVGPNRRPTFEDVKDCKYLRAVINETLRLYPPVPFNGRPALYSSCKRSTTFPARDGGKPFYIPAGSRVPYSVWLMHRRKDLWGPTAQEFDPDRFLDERLHKYLTPNPFIFLPFNAGPRICLGQQFAYNEASFMLVRLLQAFDTITLAPDAQPLDSRPPASWKSASGRQAKEKLWPKSHLTLYSHKGLWLKMGEAKHTDTV